MRRVTPRELWNYGPCEVCDSKPAKLYRVDDQIFVAAECIGEEVWSTGEPDERFLARGWVCDECDKIPVWVLWALPKKAWKAATKSEADRVAFWLARDLLHSASTRHTAVAAQEPQKYIPPTGWSFVNGCLSQTTEAVCLA
jgi:hypothetical protein